MSLLTAGKLVLAIVRSRWPILAGVGGSCLAAAVGYAWLAPDEYKAVATLFIETSPFDTGALAAGGAHITARGSGLDLLRSERVAQRVVENERLVEEPTLRQLYLESIDSHRAPAEAIARYLTEHVDASAAGDGGVVQLAATMRNSELAARVANAYAPAWGEVSLELRAASIRNGLERANQDLAFLRARLGQARARRSDDGAALAAAGSRADEQFAQLSHLSAQPVPVGGIPADWAHGVSAALVPEPAGAARFDPGPRTDEGKDAVPRPSHWTEAVAADAKSTPMDRGRSSTTADDEMRLAQQSLERAEERLARLSADSIGAPFPAHLLRPANVPESSLKPDGLACAGIGALFGVLLGLLAVVVAELSDRRIRRGSDVARGLGIVVLGELPAAASTGSARRIGEAAPARWLGLQQA